MGVAEGGGGAGGEEGCIGRNPRRGERFGGAAAAARVRRKLTGEIHGAGVAPVAGALADATTDGIATIANAVVARQIAEATRVGEGVGADGKGSGEGGCAGVRAA